MQTYTYSLMHRPYLSYYRNKTRPSHFVCVSNSYLRNSVTQMSHFTCHEIASIHLFYLDNWKNIKDDISSRYWNLKINLYLSCLLRPRLYILCIKNNAWLQLSSGIILLWYIIPHFTKLFMPIYDLFQKFYKGVV